MDSRVSVGDFMVEASTVAVLMVGGLMVAVDTDNSAVAAHGNFQQIAK